VKSNNIQRNKASKRVQMTMLKLY